MTLGTCKPCLFVWSWSKLCDWKKKKNDWFWINCVFLTNLGIETGIDYIGKRKKNHGVVTSCVIERNIMGFGGRRKMMGFGRSVDLKI